MSELLDALIYRCILRHSPLVKLSLLFSLLATSFGCVYEPVKVEGPVPAIASVSPPAVCTAQLVTEVRILGSRLSPLVVDALTDSPTLELPEVSLKQAQDLAGQPVDVEARVLASSAEDGGQSYVTWESQQALLIRVDEELALNQGLYSISVANPNGHAVELPDALVAIPPPTLASASPDLVCADQGNVLTLGGDFFVRFGSSMPQVGFTSELVLDAADMSDCRFLPGSSGAEACRDLSVEISAGTLPTNGATYASFNVAVTNPESVQCHSTESVVLTAVPRPTLASITPLPICAAQGANTLSLSGAGFLRINGQTPTLQLGTTSFATEVVEASCTQVTGPSEAVHSCKELVASIPQQSLLPGVYSAVVANPSPASCVTTEVVSFQVVPPPAIASVEPDLACVAGGDRSVTVRGSDFLVFHASAAPEYPTVAIDGTPLVTTISAGDCVALEGPVADALKCSALSVIVPVGVGSQAYSLSVTNPSPAACRAEPSASFVVMPPPSLTSIAPAAVCVSQSEMDLTVTGADFLVVDGQLPLLHLDAGVAGGYQLAPENAAALAGCTTLTGVTESVQVCSGFVVTLPQNVAASGVVTYRAWVENPLPAGCVSGELTVTRYPPPTVTSVSPTTLCSGGGVTTVTGVDFSPEAQVLLDTIPAGNVVVSADGTTATATFSSLPVGTYDLNFVNAGGCSDLVVASVTVDVGPVAFFVDPPVVWNGIDTQITIYATDLTAPVVVDLLPTAGGTPVALTGVDFSDVNRIKAVVPISTSPGSYSVRVSGAGAGCNTAILTGALSVVSETRLNLTAVHPGFGWTGDKTPVTLDGDNTGGGFVATPRVYFTPASGSATAVALEAVTFLDATRLTAVVPDGLLAATYNIIVVNPDGSVGVSDEAIERFAVVSDPPPRIDGVSPGSVLNQAGRTLTVTGSDFRSPAVGLNCTRTDGTTASVDATETSSNATSYVGTFDASTLDQAVCIVKLTNGDNNTFDEFSALVVTKLDQKLSTFKAGPELNVARRGLSSAAGRATAAARYLYAIGGDDGTDSGVHRTVEATSVDIYGNLSGFKLLQHELNTARALAGVVAVGRFIYVVGGTTDGSAVTTSVERAYVLSPNERPVLDSLSLAVNETSGVGGGTWYYKVAAVMPSDHAFNPGGESLPSEAFVVRLPDLGTYSVRVTLTWSAVADAVGYRVYRSPASDAAPGSEQLIAELGSVLTFTDTGLAVQVATPLVMGSLGKWHLVNDAGGNPLALAEPRQGAGVTHAINPDGSAFHMYVLGGHNGTTPTNNYQYCTIALESDGRQTVSQNFAVGTEQFALSRWQAGAFWANPSNAPNVGTHHYIYLGGGLSAVSAVVNDIDVGEVQWPSGVLSAFTHFPERANMLNQAGYAPLVANNFMYALGGQNNVASVFGAEAFICNGDSQSGCTGTFAPEVKNWTNTSATLLVPRILMGSAMESAFIYLVGGKTTTEAATRSTEMTVW